MAHFKSIPTLAWSLLLAITLITGLGLGSSMLGWPFYLEILSHFQVQYLVISLGLLGLLSGITRKWPFWLGLVCCIALASPVLTWYVPGRTQTPERANLRVLIANVNVNNQRYDQVAELVAREAPDLALFMEVNPAWRAQLDQTVPLPYRYSQLNRDDAGIALYSKYALLSPQVKYFGTRVSASVLTPIEIDGQRLILVATHPLPPTGIERFRARNRQLQGLGDLLQTADVPILLLGDLNITMWSPYYRRFVNQSRLKNARKGFGILPSWPTQRSFNGPNGPINLLFSIPIDHCLHSPSIGAMAHRLGAAIGSDHRPLIVDLRVPTDA